MTSENERNVESADAKKVDSAIGAIVDGKFDEAEVLLLSVVSNTPTDYTNVDESDEEISIKFWDQAAFIHYVTWQRQQGLANKRIAWIPNAYPRAYYYMGFLCVKRKQFDRALEFLDRGKELEPTNPKFDFEKAQALVHSGRREVALQLYQQVNEVNEHVSARDLAIAHRGRGFVQIEMGDLDGAEANFQSSLGIEPDNEIALNELQYIEHLRQGGTPTHTEAVPSSGPDLSRCYVCGKEFDQGVVVAVKGVPVSICNQCEPKYTKKWWQFWK